MTNNNIPLTQSDPKKANRFWCWIPVLLLSLMLLVSAWAVLFKGLTGEFVWYGLQIIGPIIGLIFLIVTLIKIIRHRKGTPRQWIALAVSVLAILPIVNLFTPVRYPYFLSLSKPAATVRLPADAPLQVIWGGDKLKNNNHVFSPDQRWAYDFLVEPYFSGSANLNDYGCYGVPVMAPIDGMVTFAHDNEPDEIPGVISNNVTNPKGNYVVIKMESDTYLVIAHLQPGSVAVQTGDAVTEGQVIGACGNSGNTSEPHIHIHHQRIDPEVWGVGYGEGLPLYFRDHDGPPMPEGGYEIIGNKAVPLGPVVSHVLSN
ncbi:MAG: M23 family metallopeptidase [Anaerolineae bacterium]|nr:M23 family metallopeptidase [Anaerolineae bacterium]